MFDRLKKNKGYYTLLLTDAAVGSVQQGVHFALINPPLAIAVSILNFGANVVAGIIMAPKVGQTPAPALAESAAAVSTEKEPRLKRAKDFYRKARTYQISTFRDPKYVVESTASGAGLTLLFEAAVGMKSVLATHSILFLTAVSPPLGIAVGATLAAIGLYGVIVGNHAKWKGISQKYTAAFRKDDAGSSPENVRKNFLEKFADRPRIQKLLNSRWSKVTRSILLQGMTIESAIFTLIAAPAVLVTHIVAMTKGTHAILTGALPLIVAVDWARGPVWHAFCVGWLHTRNALHLTSKIKAKKATAKKPAVEKTAEAEPDHTTSPAPESTADPVAAPLDPAAKPLASTFEEVAGNDAIKEVATAAVSEKKHRSRRKSKGPGSDA